MSSEDFDKKIIESLEQRSPDYNEKSWEKMQKILEKHLPQKKDDRKRLLFLLFLFLIVGGGTAIFLLNNGNKKSTSQLPDNGNNSIVSAKQTPETESLKSPTKKNTAEIKVQKTGKNEPATKIVADTKKEHLSENKNPDLIPRINNNANAISKKQKGEKAATNNIFSKSETKQPVIAQIIKSETKIIHEETFTTSVKEKIEQPDVQQPEKMKEVAANKSVLPESIKKEDEIKLIPENNSTEKKGNQKSKTGKFSLTLSAGPEMSYVRFTKPRKVMLSYGAGLSYAFAKSFSIRTGFYISRKIYAAAPQDYNPPTNFWNYYPDLKSINADCKIYEVPINIDYRFKQSKNKSWFVSAGTSNFFMKKEVYDYYYKPPYSTQYANYTRTFENLSKHYFSTLNLSAGYSRKINSHFTLQAEPFTKIALKGIGYGKVKLNSSGIVFTASFSPFSKK